MPSNYCLFLTKNETLYLHKVLAKEKSSSQRRKRIMALMMASQGKTSRSEIADAVGLSVRGIEEILKRISSNDFESTVMGRSRGHKKRVLEEEDEIKLVRLSRVTDENGLKKWTLRGLKEIFVTSGGKQVSHETIRRVLNKYKDTKDPDKVELDKNTIDKDS